MKFHTIYNHNSPSSSSGGVSMTDQQYASECDINSILRNYGAVGKLPVIREGVSGDFSSIGDFQACLERVNRAKDEFSSLPSDIRARFGNDPVAYVKFCLDPANTDECIRLGLKVKVERRETAEEILAEIRDNTRVTPTDGGTSAKSESASHPNT